MFLGFFRAGQLAELRRFGTHAALKAVDTIPSVRASCRATSCLETGRASLPSQATPLSDAASVPAPRPTVSAHLSGFEA